MHVINDFPTDYKSCSTFNIENLAAYKGLAITPYDTSHLLSHDPITNPMTHPAPPNISPTCKEFWMSLLFVSTGNGGVQYNLIHWKGRWELNCTKINKEEPASTRPWSTTSTPVTQNYNWPKLVLIWISLDVILFCYMISGIMFIYIYIPYWCNPKSLFKKVSSKHRRQINRLWRNEILCWKFSNTRCWFLGFPVWFWLLLKIILILL